MLALPFPGAFVIWINAECKGNQELMKLIPSVSWVITRYRAKKNLEKGGMDRERPVLGEDPGKACPGDHRRWEVPAVGWHQNQESLPAHTENAYSFFNYLFSCLFERQKPTTARLEHRSQEFSLALSHGGRKPSPGTIARCLPGCSLAGHWN